MHNGIVDKIRAAGGEVYAITSEPQRLADNARADWQLNFESVGDPHHEIANACRERGWLELFVNTKTELMESSEGALFRHPKGYFQPGVLALDNTGRVLYRWRGVPTRKNMGGATERPTANHVYAKLSQALTTPGAEKPADAELDRQPELDMRGIPWPIFVSILTANGWFIKPKTFAHMPDGPSIKRRFLGAALRIPLFIGAWGLALTLLPTAWVGIAFAGWMLWLTPHVRYINDQFQNVEKP